MIAKPLLSLAPMPRLICRLLSALVFFVLADAFRLRSNWSTPRMLRCLLTEVDTPRNLSSSSFSFCCALSFFCLSFSTLYGILMGLSGVPPRARIFASECCFRADLLTSGETKSQTFRMMLLNSLLFSSFSSSSVPLLRFLLLGCSNRGPEWIALTLSDMNRRRSPGLILLPDFFGASLAGPFVCCVERIGTPPLPAAIRRADHAQVVSIF
mmetsp:Transcript_23774/g.55390  ORF Transcript_23774/g.55390 Transcript_23774/m.55390 type:complete len:211 (-) Transcript_23774:31-663(-)